MDWFLYDNGLRHERVNRRSISTTQKEVFVENTIFLYRKTIYQCLKKLKNTVSTSRYNIFFKILASL